MLCMCEKCRVCALHCAFYKTNVLIPEGSAQTVNQETTEKEWDVLFLLVVVVALVVFWNRQTYRRQHLLMSLNNTSTQLVSSVECRKPKKNNDDMNAKMNFELIKHLIALQFLKYFQWFFGFWFFFYWCFLTQLFS